MEQEQEKEYFIQKMNNKTWYRVYVSGANGKTFYKLMVSQKNYDGTEMKYYQNVSFKKSLTPPQDGVLIRIKQAIQNFFGDDKYNPKSSYMILDFEVKQNQEQKEAQAFDEYNATREENEIDNFDIDLDNVDLPF